MQIAIFGDPDRPEFLRNIPAIGQIRKAQRGGFKFVENPFGDLDTIASSDEPIEILDVLFRIFRKKNAVRHQDWDRLRRTLLNVSDAG